jgi:GDP-4-dehydro-6-deoxy-D-mannose reductase
VTEAIDDRPEVVVHLAALASGAEARRDPGRAWEVNAAGTARLAHALGEQRSAGQSDPLLLLISTAEVYGVGAAMAPRREDQAPAPVLRRASQPRKARGRPARIAGYRPCSRTLAGQSEHYVVPAFAHRSGGGGPGSHIKTGNLELVRDFRRAMSSPPTSR